MGRINKSDVNGLQSVSQIKKKLRDTERLLRKEKLPETVRTDQTRLQKHLKKELANAEEKRKAQKLSSKYKMVRFFERQKATRKLKKAEKKLELTADKEEIKKLKSEIAKYNLHLKYILDFPINKKYISLYNETTPETEKERNSILNSLKNDEKNITPNKKKNHDFESINNPKNETSNEHDDFFE